MRADVAVHNGRCELAEAIRKHREREEALTRQLHLKEMAKMAELARESEYRREVVGSHLPHCVSASYPNAKFPCSQWWIEYLHCIVRDWILSYIRICSLESECCQVAVV